MSRLIRLLEAINEINWDEVDSAFDSDKIKEELLNEIRSLFSSDDNVYNTKVVGKLAEFILNYWIANKLGKTEFLPDTGSSGYGVKVDKADVTEQIKSLDDRYWEEVERSVRSEIVKLHTMLKDSSRMGTLKIGATTIDRVNKHLDTIYRASKSGNHEEFYQATKDFLSDDSIRVLARTLGKANSGYSEDSDLVLQNNFPVNTISTLIQNAKTLAPSSVTNTKAVLNRNMYNADRINWTDEEYPSLADIVGISSPEEIGRFVGKNRSPDLDEIGEAILRVVYFYECILWWRPTVYDEETNKTEVMPDTVVGEDFINVVNKIYNKDMVMEKISGVISELDNEWNLVSRNVEHTGEDGRKIMATRITSKDNRFFPKLLNGDGNYAAAISKRWLNKDFKISANEGSDVDTVIGDIDAMLQSVKETRLHRDDFFFGMRRELLWALKGLRGSVMHVLNKYAAKHIRRQMTEEEAEEEAEREKRGLPKFGEEGILSKNREQIKAFSGSGRIGSTVKDLRKWLEKSKDIIDRQQDFFNGGVTQEKLASVVDLMKRIVTPKFKDGFGLETFLDEYRKNPENGKEIYKQHGIPAIDETPEPVFGSLIVQPFVRILHTGEFDDKIPEKFSNCIDKLNEDFKTPAKLAEFLSEIDKARDMVLNNFTEWWQKLYDRNIIMRVRQAIKKNLYEDVKDYEKIGAMDVSDLKWTGNDSKNPENGGWNKGYTTEQLAEIRRKLKGDRDNNGLADIISSRLTGWDWANDKSIDDIENMPVEDRPKLKVVKDDEIMDKVFNLDPPISDEAKRIIKQECYRDLVDHINLFDDVMNAIHLTYFNLENAKKEHESLAGTRAKKQGETVRGSHLMAGERTEDRSYRSPNAGIVRPEKELAVGSYSSSFVDLTKNCAINIFERIQKKEFAQKDETGNVVDLVGGIKDQLEKIKYDARRITAKARDPENKNNNPDDWWIGKRQDDRTSYTAVDVPGFHGKKSIAGAEALLAEYGQIKNEVLRKYKTSQTFNIYKTFNSDVLKKTLENIVGTLKSKMLNPERNVIMSVDQMWPAFNFDEYIQGEDDLNQKVSNFIGSYNRIRNTAIAAIKGIDEIYQKGTFLGDDITKIEGGKYKAMADIYRHAKQNETEDIRSYEREKAENTKGTEMAEQQKEIRRSSRSGDFVSYKIWDTNRAADWLIGLFDKLVEFRSAEDIDAFYDNDEELFYPISAEDTYLRKAVDMMAATFDITLDFYSEPTSYMSDEDTLEKVENEIDRIMDELNQTDEHSPDFDKLKWELDFLKKKKSTLKAMDTIQGGGEMEIRESNWQDVVKGLDRMAQTLLINNIDTNFDRVFSYYETRKSRPAPTP